MFVWAFLGSPWVVAVVAVFLGWVVFGFCPGTVTTASCSRFQVVFCILWLGVGNGIGIGGGFGGLGTKRFLIKCRMPPSGLDAV